MEFLEFEKPIEKLYAQLEKFKELDDSGEVDTRKTEQEIKKTIEETKKKIYKDLTPWQRVQLSRHPNRPYTLDFIAEITEGNYIEVHGDRHFGDDKAMITCLGKIDGQSFAFIGQQKGSNTKERQYRRFGMPNPEGYRKALRVMKLAEKFNMPIVTFLDTPGAYPGLEAEERGQGEAIAKNIYEMLQLKVPVITVVIGEGASGGALGIGVGNKVFMMENTWYSVISPESCSSILWRSWEYKEQAAEALKLTAEDMSKLGLIDGIIKEPLGGAHYDPPKAIREVKKLILKQTKALSKFSGDELRNQRMDKYMAFGEFSG